MPMLYSAVKTLVDDLVKEWTDNAGSGQHGVAVGQLIYDIDAKRVSLASIVRKHFKAVTLVHTLVPTMRGAGIETESAVPPAMTALRRPLSTQ